MTPPLTPVPATLPGLVRRGTPLFTVEPVFVGGTACAAGMQCTTGAAADSAGRVRAICAFGSISLPIACLAVDLTDATGRDHGLRALAAHHNRSAPGVWWLPLDDGRWSLRCEPRGGFVTFRAPGAPELSKSRPEVPSLADLDPNDPTLLADGSRWVDAEALARVLLHVLGGAP